MGGGLVLNTVQICAMARSILLILALPYTLRFSLFEQYWALCLSSSLFDSLGFREARWSHPNEDKHKAPSSTPYKYRFFNAERGHVSAHGVFAFSDAPFPFAFSSCSQLKVWAV